MMKIIKASGFVKLVALIALVSVIVIAAVSCNDETVTTTDAETTATESTTAVATTTEPTATTTTPVATTTEPVTTTTSPVATTTAPMATTTAPVVTTTVPEVTTTAPEVTTTAPETTTAAAYVPPITLPGIIVTTRPATTVAPETTSTPEETTSTPEETTSTPEETTSTPEETTSTPEETTSTPEETTSTPEETTSTPDQSEDEDPEGEPLTAADYVVEGDGSASAPYKVGTAAQLDYVVHAINGKTSLTIPDTTTTVDVTPAANGLASHITLIADIAWDDYIAPTDEKNWTPIGDINTVYSGTFDGGMHTLSGVYVYSDVPGSGAYGSGTGLFGVAGDGAVIKNLVLADSQIMGARNVGGIVGYHKGGTLTIENCANLSNVTILANACVGGILGSASLNSSMKAQETTIIRNCVNYGLITDSSATETVYAAGIVGRCAAYGSAIIENCANFADINASGKYCIGGIVGQIGRNGVVSGTTNKITNCYNAGDINGSRIVGGIAGRLYEEVLTDSCYNVGVVTMEDSSEERVGLVGGINGNAGTNKNNPGNVTNSYYLENTAYVDVETPIYYNTASNGAADDLLRGIALAESAMKGSALISLGFSSDVWTANADGYPTLKGITVIDQYVEELMPEVSEDGNTYYVNDFMNTESEDLDLYVASSSDEKQDGFVFVYKNEVLVHDGGNKDTTEGSTYKYLYDLRKSLLPDGVSVSNTSYKLKITIVVSHFHGDHVNSLINNIIPSPYFEIVAVYYPEMSDFENTSYYALATLSSYTDGTEGSKGRVAFLKALKKYYPSTVPNVIDFGKTAQIKTADGKVIFDLYAPSQDWGSESGAKYILDTYYNGGASSSTSTGLPLAVVNSNSMWLKVTYGDRTMLFTGDVMKKSSDAYAEGQDGYVAEPFDLMLSYYGIEMYDVDIIKFPHHGQSRPRAMKGVIEAITPALMLFTATDYQTSMLNQTQYWANYTDAYCANDNAEGFMIRTNGKAVDVCKSNVWNDTNATSIYDADGNRTSAAGEVK